MHVCLCINKLSVEMGLGESPKNVVNKWFGYFLLGMSGCNRICKCCWKFALQNDLQVQRKSVLGMLSGFDLQ